MIFIDFSHAIACISMHWMVEIHKNPIIMSEIT